MLSAFVSYSHHDAATAEQVASRLDAAGIKVWWDQHLGSSSSMHAQIDEHLQNADKVLVLWSSSSVKSDWVVAEAEYAAKNNKLVSVKIAQCDPPVRFRIYNYIETDDLGADFAIVLQALLNVNKSRALQFKEKSRSEFFVGLVVGRYRIGVVIGAVLTLLATFVALPLSLFFNAQSERRMIASTERAVQEEKEKLATLQQEVNQHQATRRHLATTEEALQKHSWQLAQAQQALNDERDVNRRLAGASKTGKEPSRAQPPRVLANFASPEAAYQQGMGAWRSGFVEHAVPALQYAASNNIFLAQYYLARIYSDSGTPHTDHVAAYTLYEKIALDHANIDPDDDQRRPFVARAIVALAGYVRTGLPQIDLKPDPARAVEYVKHAAQFFNDEEAQFELAKTYLQGDGVPADTRSGLHWLSVLTQRGHAGAQAFLADIYWLGRYNVMRDPTRAFALISVAVEHAPESERLWIEDIYQNIYCGAPAGTRTQAQGMVVDWRQKYGRIASTSPRSALGGPMSRVQRTCANGEKIPVPAREPSENTPGNQPTPLPQLTISVPR